MAEQAIRRQNRVPLSIQEANTDTIENTTQPIQVPERQSKAPTIDFAPQQVPTFGQKKLNVDQVPLDLPPVSNVGTGLVTGAGFVRDNFQPIQEIPQAGGEPTQVPDVAPDTDTVTGAGSVDTTLPDTTIPGQEQEAQSDIVSNIIANVPKEGETIRPTFQESDDYEPVFRLSKTQEQDEPIIDNRILERAGSMGKYNPGSPFYDPRKDTILGKGLQDIGGMVGDIAGAIVDIIPTVYNQQKFNNQINKIYADVLKEQGLHYKFLLNDPLSRLTTLSSFRSVEKSIDKLNQYAPNYTQNVEEVLRKNGINMGYKEYTEFMDEVRTRTEPLYQDQYIQQKKQMSRNNARNTQQLANDYSKKTVREMLKEDRRQESADRGFFSQVATKTLEPMLNDYRNKTYTGKYRLDQIGQTSLYVAQHVSNIYNKTASITRNNERELERIRGNMDKDDYSSISNNISKIKEAENIYKNNRAEFIRMYNPLLLDNEDEMVARRKFIEQIKGQGYNSLEQFLKKGIENTEIGRKYAYDLERLDPFSFFKKINLDEVSLPMIDSNQLITTPQRILSYADIVGQDATLILTDMYKTLGKGLGLLGDFSEADAERILSERIGDVGYRKSSTRALSRNVQSIAPELLASFTLIGAMPGGNLRTLETMSSLRKTLPILQRLSNPKVINGIVNSYNVGKGTNIAVQNFLQGQAVGATINAVLSEPYTPRDANIDLMFGLIDLGPIITSLKSVNRLSNLSQNTITKILGENPSIADIKTLNNVLESQENFIKSILKQNPQLATQDIKKGYFRKLVNDIFEKNNRNLSQIDILFLDRLAKKAQDTTVNVSDFILSSLPRTFDKKTGQQIYKTVNIGDDIASDIKIDMPTTRPSVEIPTKIRDAGIDDINKPLTEAQVNNAIKKSDGALDKNSFIRQEDGRYILNTENVDGIVDNRKWNEAVLDTYAYNQKSADDFYNVLENITLNKGVEFDTAMLKQNRAYEQVYQMMRGITDNFLDC